MNKKYIRIIGAFVIVVSLCLPYLSFVVLDYMNIEKKVNWQNTSLDAQMMDEYPIIKAIYDDFYYSADYFQKGNTYIVKQKDEYSSEQQNQMEKMRLLFQNEVNELLENEVIPYSFLELADHEPFEVDFGTLGDYSDDQGGFYTLDLVYRLLTDHDHMVYLTYVKDAHKITEISIHSQDFQDLTEDDLKTMAYQMIVYLGLGQLDDWNYTDYGYESFKAKLQVNCHLLYQNNETQLSIQINPLGQMPRNSTYTIDIK